MQNLLSQQTRDEFQTLLDGLTFQKSRAQYYALTYITTGTRHIRVSQMEFRIKVMLYGKTLQDLGIQPRDLVLIAHTQNLESIYLFWGAMFIGAIPSMFPTLTPKLDQQVYMSNLAKLVEHSDAKAIFTTQDFAPKVQEVVRCQVFHSGQMGDLSTYIFDEEGLEDLEDAFALDFIPYQADPDDIAFLQHSSGTTGLQKGVALSHRAVLNQLASYSDAVGFHNNDAIISWLPLYHDMGLIAGFLLPIIQGVPLLLMSPFDWVQYPHLLLNSIYVYKPTLCWLPNFAYNHSARRIRKTNLRDVDLSSIRAFINCSEPVQYTSHQLFIEQFEEYGIQEQQLAVSYAMAENTFAVTQTTIGTAPYLDIVDREQLAIQQQAVPVNAGHENAETQVSCGKPIDGVEIYIVNSDNQPLPERSVGEIAIHSNCIFTGYYNRPDLNENLFVDGWYHTGDMGYVANGELFVIGRKKDIIINGGKNIYPQDLEVIVNEVEGIHAGRVVAFGVPDEQEGTELIAILAETDIVDIAEQKQLAKAIRKVIANQTTVTANFVELVEPGWLLKTSSGKIARSANREKWLQSRKK